MLGSSTPDGLAPLSVTGLLIFTTVICGISLLYGIFSLARVLRISTEGESPEKIERVAQLSRKIYLACLQIYKLDAAVSFVAMLIFFLLIMGALDHFAQFFNCVAYLLGVINSIICGSAVILTSHLANTRILNLARFSGHDAYHVAKLVGNFYQFFVYTWNIFWIAIFLVIYQLQHEQIKAVQQITKISTVLISFAFGSATVAIGGRICHSIYQKGAETAVDTLAKFEDRLERNHKHPALICKAVGEILNKQLSAVLDNTLFLTAAIGLATHAAARYVVGSDQEGEIIFQQSYHNIYLPVMACIFAFAFLFIANIVLSLVIKPGSGDGIRTLFNLERYITIFFLIGFLSLVSYLCLPAEFFIEEFGQQFIRHPYHAYLCLLFGLLLTLVLSAGSEVFATHPFFINSLSEACSTGPATNIISGLSFGYFFNFVPVILMAGLGYLGMHWIGTFGVGLLGVGTLLLFSTYMNYSIVFSLLDNCSYISYICKLDQTVTTTLIDLAKTRKDFEPHLQSIYYGCYCYLGYEIYLLFLDFTTLNQDSISLKESAIFLGVLCGAMFPYFYSACIIRSIARSFPAIAFDLRMQIEEIPSMAQSSIDPDFLRTNGLFGFQCIFSLKRFVPILFIPFIVLGIGLGPKSMLGFLVGSAISGVQLGLSNGISGTLWSNVKKEINLGNLRNQEANGSKSGSEWGTAAEIGSQVGLPLRDGVNSGIHIVLLYTGLLFCILGPVSQRIHS